MVYASGQASRTRLVVAATVAVLAGAYVPVAMPILAPDLERGLGLRAGALGVLLSAGMAGGLVGGLLSAVLSHGGGNLDLSHLLQGAGGLLGAFTRR